MTAESILNVIAAIAVPLATLAGYLSQKRRLRSDIRDNLSLLQDLEKNVVLHHHTPVTSWLTRQIAQDVARLTGEKLGTSKRPISWGSVTFAGILTLAFALWTYYLVRDHFVWYSVFPGVVAVLMLMSLLGQFTNREIPPEEQTGLPPGAIPLKRGGPIEQVISDQPRSHFGDPSMLDERKSDTAFNFARAMAAGNYEEGIAYADENWLFCRIQSWLWNNRQHFGDDVQILSALAHSMLQDHSPEDAWREFVTTERNQFVETWRDIDFNRMGIGSRERRVDDRHEIILLVPLGETNGFLVTGPTLVNNVHRFVLAEGNEGFLISNHVGSAPPILGWPPDWRVDDRAE